MVKASGPHHRKAFRNNYLAAFGIAVLFLISATADAQIIPNPNKGNYGTRYNRIAVDSTFYFPTGCGIPTDTLFLFSQQNNGKGQKGEQAAMYYDSCGHHLYLWDPSLKLWHLADSTSSGGGTDSTIAGRLGVQVIPVGTLRFIQADTGYMASRARLQQKADSLGNLIGKKQDTAAFHLYIKRKGQPGDSTLVTATDSTLWIAAIRDSLGFHHVVNADGSWTMYATGGGSGTDTTILPGAGMKQAYVGSVKTLNNDTASATQRGMLSAADYTVIHTPLYYVNDSAGVGVDSLTYYDPSTHTYHHKGIVFGWGHDRHRTTLQVIYDDIDSLHVVSWERLNKVVDSMKVVYDARYLQIKDSTKYATFLRLYKVADSLGALKIGLGDSTKYASFARLYKTMDSLNLIVVKKGDSTLYSTFARLYKVVDSFNLVMIHKGDSAGVGYTTLARTRKVIDSLGLLISGVGGSQTLPQVLATGRTLTASDSILIASLKNLHFKGIIATDTLRSYVKDTVKLTVSDTYIGTSVTAGSGASIVAKNFVSLVAAGLNSAPNNQGIGGSTYSKPPGTSAPSILTTLHSIIPARDATHRYVFIEGGENDSWYASQYCCNILDYSTLRSKIAVDTVVNYIKAQGYDSTCMFWISPVWQSLSRTAKIYQDSIFNAYKTEAAAYHIPWIDIYTQGQYNETSVMADGVHPSDVGHAIIANIVLQFMDSINTVKINGQTLAVNGPGEFKKLTLRNADTAKPGYWLAALQPNGDVAKISPDRFLKLQNSTDIYQQTGSISTSGAANFSGQVTTVSSVKAGGVGGVGGGNYAYLGFQSGVGFLQSFSNTTAIGTQISYFQTPTSIGNVINFNTLSSGSKVQLFGGTYVQSYLAIDSGAINTNHAYWIVTNGTDLFWTDKTGTGLHQLSGSGGSWKSVQNYSTNFGSTYTARSLIDKNYADSVAAHLRDSLGALIGGGGFTNPMTTVGDIIYGGASGAGTRLAGNTTTTRKMYFSTGTGSVAQAPTLDVLQSSDIPNNAANTSGTAANLSGTPALPNGTTVTTQSPGDNTTKPASTAFVTAAVGVVAISSYTPTLGTNVNLSSGSTSSSSYSVTNGAGVHSLIWGSLTATAASTVSSQEFNLPVTTTQSAGVVIGTFFWGPAAGAATGVNGLVKVVNSTTARIDFFTGATTTNGNFVVTLDYSH